MANLNDLPIPSISSLPPEEGLQCILSIRERRRFIPEKTVRKKVPIESAIAKMSEQQITDLYYQLMAKQQKELL